MGPEEWQHFKVKRLDRALTDFIRKKISADEYQRIREQSYEEFIAESETGLPVVTSLAQSPTI